jgi:hypothetical protein
LYAEQQTVGKLISFNQHWPDASNYEVSRTPIAGIRGPSQLEGEMTFTAQPEGNDAEELNHLRAPLHRGHGRPATCPLAANGHGQALTYGGFCLALKRPYGMAFR